MFRLALSTVTVFFILAAPALAQTDIFPPLVAGKYAFKVQSAPVALDSEGIPMQPATASCALFVTDDPATLLAVAPGSSTPPGVVFGANCVDMGPDELVPVNVTVPAVGDYAKVKARAYEGPGCTGQTSPDSDESAVVYFVGPASPGVAE